MRLFRSFYGRLAALFLLLLLVLGVAIGALVARSALRLTEAADQKVHRDLARDLVPRFEPHLAVAMPDSAAIASIIEGLTSVNRRIDVYLLDPTGMIKLAVVRPGQPLQLRVVDTAPLDRLIAGDEDLPILGEDPLAPGRTKPFSVASVTIGGVPECYLYIVLAGERYASALDMLANSHMLRAVLGGLALTLAGAALVGLVLFSLLTRRLRRMTAAVQAFETGQLDRRAPAGEEDEVGRLGAAFNRMADTLARHVAALEQADRRRQEFVEGISHDLRTPLASLKGYAETLVLKGDAIPAEERLRYLEVILANANRLGTLADGLFEVAKWEAEGVAPQPEPFSIAELVQDIVVQHRPDAAARGVDLAASLPEKLPRVHADVGMVDRVIQNLITNALRHTPPGGRVEVAPWQEGDRVWVRVSDTGEGIAAEDLPHVFERYFRRRKGRGADGGAGLGLFISKKMLEAHGGSISVESKPGKGTTFRFDLPVWH
ncbi:MAG TPA: HAMP domain-containing sensor histidine kinase [Rubricoccaceae bacterium]|nr:HAMP domain-containing sensor histidine kinase [Rubricoccaceae bacterium]